MTGKIIGCFYSVYNNLGCGFLEKVYRNALKMELEMIGLRVEVEKPIQVNYRGKVIGEYYADLYVEDSVIVELKCVSCLGKEHEAQLINYLAATSTSLGLLLNFGPKPQVKRKIYSIRRNNKDNGRIDHLR